MYETYESNPHLEERNRLLISNLPEDVASVLDVGSGPGVFGRAVAATGRRVFSTDLSIEGLLTGPPHAFQSSALELPHRSREFDLVASLEVLEHIPDELLNPMADEIARVSSSWLLIGVPHRENLLRNHLRCPSCGSRFNRTGHLQSFDSQRLGSLFPDFETRWSQVCGPPVRDYRAPLLWMRHNVARRFSEMSGLGGNICPQCGQTTFPEFRHNPLSFALDGMNKLISSRRPYWIIELMERKRP